MQEFNITRENAEEIVLNLKSGQLIFSQIKTFILNQIIELLEDPSLSLIAQEAINKKKSIFDMEVQEKLSYSNIINL